MHNGERLRLRDQTVKTVPCKSFWKAEWSAPCSCWGAASLESDLHSSRPEGQCCRVAQGRERTPPACWCLLVQQKILLMSHSLNYSVTGWGNHSQGQGGHSWSRRGVQTWWSVPLHPRSPSVLAISIVKSLDDGLFLLAGLAQSGHVSGRDLQAQYCISTWISNEN